MRVEGQRMAVDYFPAKSEGIKSIGKENERGSIKESNGKSNYNADALKQAIKTANEAMKISNYHLQFKLHEGSGRYQVKVIDSQTEEVIREIPPENLLEFSAMVKKMLDEALGLLVDEKA
ncbi:MAG: flagellar protein FlaG [Syntrophomonadaceae bacterium]|nr:flagellar protein FlaG [Syntrophomonadaceae bacterium]